LTFTVTDSAGVTSAVCTLEVHLIPSCISKTITAGLNLATDITPYLHAIVSATDTAFSSATILSVSGGSLLDQLGHVIPLGQPLLGTGSAVTSVLYSLLSLTTETLQFTVTDTLGVTSSACMLTIEGLLGSTLTGITGSGLLSSKFSEQGVADTGVVEDSVVKHVFASTIDTNSQVDNKFAAQSNVAHTMYGAGSRKRLSIAVPLVLVSLSVFVLVAVVFNHRRNARNRSENEAETIAATSAVADIV